MKIYFNASMGSKNKFGDFYQRITQHLKKLGHEVHDEHVMDVSIAERSQETEEDRRHYYDQMVKKIKKSDLMVAEISYPSTVHVGHELTLALQYNKPVLALYYKGNKPMLFWGMEDDGFYVSEYDKENLEATLEEGIDFLKDHQDTRFNFFVSPKHINYMDWISKTRRIPRSVFLRRLIDQAMSQDKEYLQ